MNVETISQFINIDVDNIKINGYNNVAEEDDLVIELSTDPIKWVLISFKNKD